MKKLFFLISLITLLASCSKDEDDTLVGTRWTAIDDISTLMYGGDCFTTLEIKESNKCKQIDTHEGGKKPGAFYSEGTYIQKGDSIIWTINGIVCRGLIVNKKLHSDLFSLISGKRVYHKQ